MLYDDNHISIEGDTDVALTEDVARPATPPTAGTRSGSMDADGRRRRPGARRRARRPRRTRPTGRRSSRCARSSRWPAPNAQNTGKAHGSALGADEVAATKKVLGFDPDKTFDVDDEVLAHARAGRRPRAELRKEWQERFDAWREANPERAALHDRLARRGCPTAGPPRCPTFPADAKGMATRKASGQVLNAIAPGAARAVGRLGRPRRVQQHDHRGRAVLPAARPRRQGVPGDPYGRVLHFGIREHAHGLDP